MRVLLSVLLLFFCAEGFAALSETEQRIVAAVKSRSNEAIALLERAVRINSGTLNVEGVREVGTLFAAEIERLGFKTRWVDLPPEMKRGGHLVAERVGTQGQRLLLLGHIDTVFEKQSPMQLWERSGNRVKGQGVNDMKGGDVVMIEALRALAAVGALDNTTIRIVLTGDEERVGTPINVSRAPMVDAAKQSDLALSFEASGIDRSGRTIAAIARRASGGFTLTVTATPGHSSRVFGQGGFGAIYEGARILNAFREKVAEPGLTFSPGLVLGGTVTEFNADTATGTAFGKSNVIPRSFIAVTDMRYLTGEQAERARAKMRAIVAESLPGTHAEITFRESYPPMAASAGSQALLAAYSQASEDAGFGPIYPGDPEERGAGDVQFTAPYIAGMDGLGTVGSGSHSVLEDMQLDSIERSAIRAAILIYRLTRDPPRGNAPR